MARMNWDKAKWHGRPTLSINDEKEFLGNDRAARWLEKRTKRLAKKGHAARMKKKRLRREKKRQAWLQRQQAKQAEQQSFSYQDAALDVLNELRSNQPNPPW